METRRSTADEQAGIQWWNSLTEAERAEALKVAGWKSGGEWTPSTADAWAVHKMRSGLGRAAAQRYLVIIDGNGDPPYVFDNESKTKIMSYASVADAEHQAKLLNSFVRPDLETHRHL